MAAALETAFITESTDIVTYLVKVGDNELSKKYNIVSLNVESGINKIPTANLLINDGDASISDFEISNSGEFEPGKKIEIQLGYQKSGMADNKTVFKGLIVKNTHKISSNQSEFLIDCKHEADIMTYTKVNKIPEKDSLDSDLIKLILEAHDITGADVKDSTTKHPQLLQVNTTDWDYIMSRVDFAKMMCIFPAGKMSILDLPKENSQVDSDKSGAAPGETAHETITLVYGKNILEFDGELDPRIESSMVKVQTWDPKNQQIQETESKHEEPAAKTPGDDQPAEVNGKLTYTYTISSPANMEEAASQSLGDMKLKRQQLSKIKGTVKFIGKANVYAGHFLKLSGVGKRFDGSAFISNIIHEYSDGCWITTATLGWDENLFTEQTNPGHAASATGQTSSIQGLHIGKVTSIEDKDGNYRVKVKLPMVDNNSEGIFARLATLDAGNKRGTFFRPEINDEVVLGFMNDDPSSPVILGMLHSSKLPAPLEPEKNNHKKGYVSRSEIKLIFDDDEKSIKIETPGSRVFEMNDNAGTISIKDEFGNKIIMEQSGITVESGADLTLKAKGKFSLSAAQFEMKADSTVNLEGNGQVSVKSSAVTEIKGSIVKLNCT